MLSYPSIRLGRRTRTHHRKRMIKCVSQQFNSPLLNVNVVFRFVPFPNGYRRRLDVSFSFIFLSAYLFSLLTIAAFVILIFQKISPQYWAQFARTRRTEENSA